ncbi:integrase [Streptomyces sp. NL15-2K]|nr:integrase [Streptomyces sp. NL15-2K]
MYLLEFLRSDLRIHVELYAGFRFYDLRHRGHALSTRSSATLKARPVRGGQPSERAALIYQHSDDDRQRGRRSRSGQDRTRGAGAGAGSCTRARTTAPRPDDQPSGTNLARDN